MIFLENFQIVFFLRLVVKYMNLGTLSRCVWWGTQYRWRQSSVLVQDISNSEMLCTLEIYKHTFLAWLQSVSAKIESQRWNLSENTVSAVLTQWIPQSLRLNVYASKETYELAKAMSRIAELKYDHQQWE